MNWFSLLIVVSAAVIAVSGGSPLTRFVFHLVDHSTDAPDKGVDDASAILRGGAWIGGLERIAIFAGMLAKWPEAIAVVLAVKSLGRYPELRAGDRSAVAERFLIGTFVSVLWACAWAGIALWLLGDT